ncbi:hypothetical protein PV325_005030 [Microctonus aethiopoides]|nr:hypothetical protein PV325_005030 [Microctonus aethiopoides]
MLYSTVIAIVCLALAISTAANDKKIVCYFGSWSVYRPGKGQFDINNIDPSLCTHLIYSFVGIKGNNIINLDPWQDLPDNYGKNGFGRFNKLREKNPSLKTIIAIGGWNEGSKNYSEMAKTAKGREEFSTNAVEFVKKYNFNGFDLDWEYPARRGGALEDKKNFIELLKVMRKDFDKYNLTISAAVSATKSSASLSYIISELNKYLDFINIMAYDLHGSWEQQTGINAPLDYAPGDNEELNVKAIVQYWLSQGCSKEKLILGMPLYGRSFTLKNAEFHGVGAPTKRPGKKGVYTKELGMLGYNEICEGLKEKLWTVHYDKQRRVPYAYNDLQWVGYDNVESIKEKAELINDLNLGGAMVWSIDTDDFNGVCGDKYPLLKTLNTVLRNGTFIITSEKSKSSRNNKHSTKNKKYWKNLLERCRNIIKAFGSKEIKSTKEQPPVSSVQLLSGQCTQSGDIPKPGSCNYISCVTNGNGHFLSYERPCPWGTCYNPENGVCDWKRNLPDEYLKSIESSSTLSTVDSSNGCTEEGKIPKPNSCDFIFCLSDMNGNFIDYKLSCPENTCYDPVKKICKWNDNLTETQIQQKYAINKILIISNNNSILNNCTREDIPNLIRRILFLK